MQRARAGRAASGKVTAYLKPGLNGFDFLGTGSAQGLHEILKRFFFDLGADVLKGFPS
jgi:hypothetical protein